MLKWYIKAASWTCAVGTLVFVLLLAASQAAASIWLSAWSDDAREAEARNGTLSRQLVHVRLGVYAALGTVLSKIITQATKPWAPAGGCKGVHLHPPGI